MKKRAGKENRKKTRAKRLSKSKGWWSQCQAAAGRSRRLSVGLPGPLPQLGQEVMGRQSVERMEGEEKEAGEWAPLLRNLVQRGGRGSSEVRRERRNPDHVDRMCQSSRGPTWGKASPQ